MGPGLTSLTELNLRGCSSFQSVSELLVLTALRSLVLDECSGLARVPHLTSLTTLTHVSMCYLGGLTNDGIVLPDFGAALQELDLSGCAVERLTDFSTLPNLRRLRLCRLAGFGGDTAEGLCPDLYLISCCAGLTDLSVAENEHLEALPALRRFTKLRRLDCSGCMRLTSLPNIGCCTALEHLGLLGCSALTSLPADISACTALKHLDLRFCTTLTSLPVDISACTALTELYCAGTKLL